MPRKPLDPDCDGGIFCPVEGHVRGRATGAGRFNVSHVPLTKGQSKTLFERHRAQTRTQRADGV